MKVKIREGIKVEFIFGASDPDKFIAKIFFCNNKENIGIQFDIDNGETFNALMKIFEEIK